MEWIGIEKGIKLHMLWSGNPRKRKKHGYKRKNGF